MIERLVLELDLSDVTLMVQDWGGPIGLAVASRRWEELFSDHRTVPIEGAGHYVQEDAPEELVAAIRAWRIG